MLGGEAAVFQKLARGRCRWRGELFAVELLCLSVCGDETLAGSRFLATARATAFIVNVEANFLRTGFDGLRERQVFHLHEEAEYITALAGGKAVVVAMIGAYVERRRALVFKRRKPFQRISASRFEVHVFCNDLLNRSPFADCRDIGVRNSSPSHENNLTQPVQSTPP